MSSLPSLSSLTPAQLAASALLALPALYLLQRTFFASRKPKPAMASETKDREPQSIMQPPKDDLAPPKDDPFTLAQLQEFDGSQPGKPIYVAIKGAPRPAPCSLRAPDRPTQAPCST
jgi:membrane-associated progesterone receptor component